MLPLDLHVLGLSLAFILSQDQTLRCTKKFLLNLSPACTEIIVRNWTSLLSQIFPYTTSCCYNNPKISIRKKKREADGDALRRLPPNTPGNRPLFFQSERDCKGKDYFPFPQYPAQLFFHLLFQAPRLPNTAVLFLKSGCKSTTLFPITQIIGQLFFKKNRMRELTGCIRGGYGRKYFWRETQDGTRNPHLRQENG